MYPVTQAPWLVRFILLFIPAKKILKRYPNGDSRTLFVKAFLSRTYLVKKVITLMKRPKYPMTADEIDFMLNCGGREAKRQFMKVMKRKYEGRLSS